MRVGHGLVSFEAGGPCNRLPVTFRLGVVFIIFRKGRIEYGEIEKGNRDYDGGIHCRIVGLGAVSSHRADHRNDKGGSPLCYLGNMQRFGLICIRSVHDKIPTGF